MKVRLATDAGLWAIIEERQELLNGLELHPEWADREAELSNLLTHALDPEGLRLVRIDMSASSALLDQIVRYEAVHPIRDPQDFARRLAQDRRLYAFFHPTLPQEPLIFTEVAVTHRLSADVRALLDPSSRIDDPRACNCAIFYSISSCHEGLRGVPLGNALIQRATEELQKLFPRLDTFATLSPVPGFRAWLDTLARSQTPSPARERAAATISTLDRAAWHADADISADLEQRLVPLCAHYLLHVKRGGDPADAVARFHLRNGARLERINWLGDVSPTGMRRAAGMIVNYLYRSTNPQRRYDAASATRIAQVSREVARLGREASVFFRG